MHCTNCPAISISGDWIEVVIGKKLCEELTCIHIFSTLCEARQPTQTTGNFSASCFGWFLFILEFPVFQETQSLLGIVLIAFVLQMIVLPTVKITLRLVHPDTITSLCQFSSKLEKGANMPIRQHPLWNIMVINWALRIKSGLWRQVTRSWICKRPNRLK